MDENLRRALEALRRGAADVTSVRSADELRARLRSTAENVLTYLEAEPEPEDLFSSLDRKSKDIAQDLRRAERLMRENTGGS